MRRVRWFAIVMMVATACAGGTEPELPEARRDPATFVLQGTHRALNGAQVTLDDFAAGPSVVWLWTPL